jgi:hypothetical protein
VVEKLGTLLDKIIKKNKKIWCLIEPLMLKLQDLKLWFLMMIYANHVT